MRIHTHKSFIRICERFGNYFANPKVIRITCIFSLTLSIFLPLSLSFSLSLSLSLFLSLFLSFSPSIYISTYLPFYLTNKADELIKNQARIEIIYLNQTMSNSMCSFSITPKLLSIMN